MKKKCLAALALIAPLTLLCACTSTPELTLESNWLNDTSKRNIPSGFVEKLEYDIAYKRSSFSESGSFNVTYTDGTYKTELREKVGEDGKQTYVYSTLLSIHAQYSYKGESTQVFEDTVETYVEFTDVASGLQPICSWRRIKYTAPISLPDVNLQSLNVGYEQYNQKTELTYEGNSAMMKTTRYEINEDKSYTDTEKGDPYEKKISVKGKGSYFDNEQLIVVLRAAELSSSLSFRTIDTTSLSAEKLKVKSGPTSVEYPVSFTINDTPVDKQALTAYELSIGYTKQNAGTPQKFILASKVKSDNNTYRNVLLGYETPVIYSHGTLVYTLKKAVFFN